MTVTYWHDAAVGAPLIAVDHGQMAGLRTSLAQVGAEFDVLPVPLRAKADDAVEAAGEFAAELGQGAAVFALSWTSALQAYGQCCALLGAHVGAASLEMQAIDRSGADALRGAG